MVFSNLHIAVNKTHGILPWFPDLAYFEGLTLWLLSHDMYYPEDNR